MADDGGERADGIPGRHQRLRELGAGGSATQRVAVSRTVEGDDAIAGGDERTDEGAELRATPLPAMDEEDAGARAPRSGVQSVAERHAGAARDQLALAIGPRVPPRPCEQLCGESPRERGAESSDDGEEQPDRREHRVEITSGGRLE